MKTTATARRFAALVMAISLLVQGFAFAQAPEGAEVVGGADAAMLDMQATPDTQAPDGAISAPETKDDAAPADQKNTEDDATPAPQTPAEKNTEDEALPASSQNDGTDAAEQAAALALADYEACVEDYLSALADAQEKLAMKSAQPDDADALAQATAALALYEEATTALKATYDALLQAYQAAALALPTALRALDAQDEAYRLPALASEPMPEASQPDASADGKPTADGAQADVPTTDGMPDGNPAADGAQADAPDPNGNAADALATDGTPAANPNGNAANVSAQIAALPTPDEITISAALDAQQRQVASARAAYDALSPDQAAQVQNVELLNSAEVAVKKALIERETMENCCSISDENIEMIAASLNAGQVVTLKPIWISDSVDIDQTDLSEFPITLTLDSGSDAAITLNGSTVTARDDLTAPKTVSVTASCKDLPAISLRYQFYVKPPMPANAKAYIFPTTDSGFAFNLADLKSATGDHVELTEDVFEPLVVSCVADGVDYPLDCNIVSASWIADDEEGSMPSWIEVIPGKEQGTLTVRASVTNKALLAEGSYSAKVRVTTDSQNSHLKAFDTATYVDVTIFDDEAFDFEDSNLYYNLMENSREPIPLGEIPSSISSFVITQENGKVVQLADQTFQITIGTDATGNPCATLNLRDGKTPKAGKTTLKVQTMWKNGGFSVTTLTFNAFKPAPKVTLSRTSISMQNVAQTTVDDLSVSLPNGVYNYKSGKNVLFTLTNEDITAVSVVKSGHNAKTYPYQACFEATHTENGAFSLTLTAPVPADSRGKLPASVRVLLNVSLDKIAQPLTVAITVKLPAASVKLKPTSVTLYQALGAGNHVQTVSMTPTPETATYTLENVEYQKPEDEDALNVTQVGNELRISTTESAQAKTYRLKLYFEGITKAVSLSVKVDKRLNSAKLQKSSLKLTRNAPDEQVGCKLTLTALNPNDADAYTLSVHEYETSKVISTQPFTKLDLSWDGAYLTVKPNSETEAGTKYVLDIGFSEAQQVAKHVKLTVSVAKDSSLKLTGRVSGKLDVTNRDSMLAVKLTLGGAANKNWAAGLDEQDITLTESLGILEIAGFEEETGTVLIGFRQWNSVAMRKNGRKAIPFTLSLDTASLSLTTPTLKATLSQSAVKLSIAGVMLNVSKPRAGSYGGVVLLNAAMDSIDVQTIRQVDKKDRYVITDLGDGYFHAVYKQNAVKTQSDTVTLEVTPKGGASAVRVKMLVSNVN